MTKYLGLHETLEINEILTFKNLCLTKSTMMTGLAQDPELKQILSTDADNSARFIKTLQEFLIDRSH
ncbi:hypothetical protein ACFYKX_01985 [Cytobacillus sp. FJAT-54145]|uniref:Spore coat protein n=1 Tax=Cytobacillus spartinae TaxID=3299023 RepID=A0ABW6K5D4_9BACI